VVEDPPRVHEVEAPVGKGKLLGVRGTDLTLEALELQPAADE
jgi:hypothetical protein